MEGLFLLKEILQKINYMCKIDLKDAYFAILLHSNLLKIYQLQMERESLSVFMPLLWPKFSSKAIDKTNEDLNFGHLEIESETDNISNSSQIHFDSFSSNFEVFD